MAPSHAVCLTQTTTQRHGGAQFTLADRSVTQWRFRHRFPSNQRVEFPKRGGAAGAVGPTWRQAMSQQEGRLGPNADAKCLTIKAGFRSEMAE